MWGGDEATTVGWVFSVAGMIRTWHVYAILGHDPGEVRLQGLGGAKVQAIRGGPIWALASECAGGTPNASDPLEHHRVIERALERWPLLPARFAAPVALDSLIHRLEHDAQAHLVALERVRDSREFAIRAEVLEAMMPTATPRAMRYTESTVLEKANTRLLEFSEQLANALAPFALEFSHRYPEPNLYRGAVLVARGRLEDFWHAFAATLAQLPSDGLHPSLHGPYPPYSFVRSGETLLQERL